MEAEAKEEEEEVRGWSQGGAGLQFLSRTPVGPTLFLSTPLVFLLLLVPG